MQRPNARTLLRWGVASAFCAGVVQGAHAASLNGIETDTLVSYSYPATIEPADENPPTIVANVSPAPNGFGWHNTAVTVSFTCDDAESGVASCTDPVTLSAEGAGQVVVGDAADNAGNTATISVTVDIDQTGPVVTLQGVVAGSTLPFLPPAVTCTASDALSGVNGPCVVTFEFAGGLFVDAVGTARDFADNLTEERVRFSISAICGVPGVPRTTPCVVPPGYTIDDDLRWEADVQVFGTITGELRVEDGNIVVEEGGIVGDGIDQRGPGGVALRSGATVDGDVEERGDGGVVVEDGASVSDGTVKESGDGSVRIDGSVDGDVEEKDAGDVVVGPTASVSDKVKESGAGSAIIAGFVGDDVGENGDGDLVVESTATVDQRVRERGDGSVIVRGIVRGDVIEEDAGDVTITAGAVVDGSVEEDKAGSITVEGTINDKITEKGAGDLTILAPAVVSSDVEEGDAGDLVIGPSVTVGGDATEKRDGNMSVGAAAHIMGDADSDGRGTCTIDPTATVDGALDGDCR